MTKQKLVLISLLIAQSLYPQSIKQWANEVAVIPLKEVSLSDLPEGLEEEVLEEMRNTNRTKTLLNMGDEVTIKQWTERYKEIEGKNVHMNRTLNNFIYNPRLIVELAPLLYLEDYMYNRPHSSVHGGADNGYSATVAMALQQIVEKSPHFSPETRASTKSPVPLRTYPLENGKSYLSSIPIMRDWWEKNEKALREGRYQDVGPLDLSLYIPAEDNPLTAARWRETMLAPSQSKEEADGAITLKSIVEEPAELVTEEPAEVVITEPIEEDIEQPSNWWLWLIGAVVVIGGLGLALRRKS